MNIKYFSTLGYDFYSTEGVSETEYIHVPICQPEVESDEVGDVSMSIDGSYLDTPSVSTGELLVGAPIMRVFSAS